MKSSVGSAITNSNEREEGEIVDDDFEDISDDSIILPVYTGKSVSSKDHLRAISLSSVTDMEEEACQKPKRRRKSTHKKDKNNLKKRKRSLRKSAHSDDSGSDEYRELDKKLQQQLKAAVHVDVEESHKNSLRTRLKAMTKLNESDSDKSSEQNVIDNVAKDSDNNEIDYELMELRTEALRTALLNKFKDKKRKVKDPQENMILSDKVDESETNKENANNNVDENNKKSILDSKLDSIEDKNVVTKVHESVPASPEEDEDVLRALLLASMSKKITTNISEKTSDTIPIANVKQITKSTSLETPLRKNNLQINRIVNRNKITVTSNKPVSLPEVKPLIINVNADSDSDEDLTNKTVQNKPNSDKSSLNNIKAAIENTVDKFLKEQRAKVEAEHHVVTHSSNKTPLKNKKPPSIEKSAVKLLPKSKQIEYQKLLLKLKNAERKPRVRKMSLRATEIKSNGAVIKSKLNRSKLLVNNKTEKSQEKKNEALLLHNTLKDMQVEVNGRLQIQERYKLLKPLVKKINERSNEKKTCDQDVKRLLEELAEAKRKQLKSHQDFTLAVTELIVEKEKLDKGGLNHKLRIETDAKKCFTSTPVKEKLSLSSFEVSAIPSVTPIESIQIEIKEPSAKNSLVKEAVVRVDTDSLPNIGDPNDIDKIILHREPDKIPKYISPLDTIKRTGLCDPFSIICPFEVDGKCRDPECSYTHLFK